MEKRSILGLAAGAGLMYFFDPAYGKRRRSQLRDQCAHLMRQTGRSLEVAARDASNRTRGTFNQLSHAWQEDPADDSILASRVRSKLGRYVSHPGAIHITVQQGKVYLDGSILQDEVPTLLSAVQSVRGVADVVNHLDVHQSAGTTPSLQGTGSGHSGERNLLMQEHWPPGARAILGSAGCALVANGMLRRTPLSTALAIAGGTLALRAFTNRQASELLHLPHVGSEVEMQRTYLLNAPVDRVFKFAMDFPQYEKHLDLVKSVSEDERGHIHWTLAGPAGTRLHLEEELTELFPNGRIAWKSVGHSLIDYQGTATFHAEAGGQRTRLDIVLRYRLPGGVALESLAGMLGYDPASMMDSMVEKLKPVIEEHQPTQEEVQERAEHAG